jgi:hypothetical protein
MYSGGYLGGDSGGRSPKIDDAGDGGAYIPPNIEEKVLKLQECMSPFFRLKCYRYICW